MEDKSKTTTSQPIRTYQSDVEQILKDGGGSLAKIAVSEQNKKIQEEIILADNVLPTSKSKLITFVSIALIMLGIGTLLLLYIFKNDNNEPVPIVQDTPRIIETDAEKIINITNLDKDKLRKKLIDEREQTQVKLASVIALKIIDGKAENIQKVTSSKFLEKLATKAPDELIRSIDDDFMYGIYALSSNQPFIIFKIGYYQNAFAGMLEWENDMREDIVSLFVKKQQSTEAATTEEKINALSPFEDAIVKNRDARVLRNENGEIIFLYTFPDKDTLIITTNADTLEQITKRLLANKLIQ